MSITELDAFVTEVFDQTAQILRVAIGLSLITTGAIISVGFIGGTLWFLVEQIKEKWRKH